jgi:hypothetical protein
MDETYYTHAMRRVKSGRQAAFIDAWLALGETFHALPNPPGQGSLLQCESDLTLFYSFGPWHNRDDIAAMRTDPNASTALKRLFDLCDDATSGTYRLAAQVG